MTRGFKELFYIEKKQNMPLDKNYIKNCFLQQEFSKNSKDYSEGIELKVKVIRHNEALKPEELKSLSIPYNQHLINNTQFVYRIEYDIEGAHSKEDYNPPLVYDKKRKVFCYPDCTDTLEATNIIQNKINLLFIHGDQHTDDKKKQAILYHATRFDEILGKFYLGQIDEATFKEQFTAQFDSAKENFKHHPNATKVLLANLAIAATVIGLFLVVGQLIYSKYTTGTAQGFFSKSKSHQLVENLEGVFKKDEPFTNSTYSTQ